MLAMNLMYFPLIVCFSTFETSVHGLLLDTVQQRLHPNGMALFLSPARGTSLARFVEAATSRNLKVHVHQDFTQEMRHTMEQWKQDAEYEADRCDMHLICLQKS